MALQVRGCGLPLVLASLGPTPDLHVLCGGVWRLLAPVTPEFPQIHVDSEIAWLVLALAPAWSQLRNFSGEENIQHF